MKKLVKAFLFFIALANVCLGQIKEMSIYVVEANKTIVTFGNEVKDAVWITCGEDPIFNQKVDEKFIYLSRKSKTLQDGQKCKLMITLEDKDKTKLKLIVHYTQDEEYPTEYDLSSSKRIDELVKASQKEESGGNAKQNKPKEATPVEDNKDDIEAGEPKVIKQGKSDKATGEEELDFDENNADEITPDDETMKSCMEALAKDKVILERKVFELVQTFAGYCDKIVNNKTNASIVSTYQKKAFSDVFHNYKEGTVQVTGKGNVPKPPTPVQDYLKKLALLSWKYVNYNAKQVRLSKVYRDPDSKEYYATVSYLSTFEGCTGGTKEAMRSCYKSNVRKTAQIHIVVSKALVDGKEIFQWRPYITSISVDKAGE